MLRLVSLLPFLLLSGGRIAGPTAAAPAAFAGTWHLVSFLARDSAGAISYTLGEHAEGLLMYDADGNMSVQMMRAARSPFASTDIRAGTVDEKSAAFDGYSAYYGRYTVDTARSTVTHHIRGAYFPNWSSSNLVRSYRFDGERLTLSTPPMAVGGRSVRSEIVWERVRKVKSR